MQKWVGLALSSSVIAAAILSVGIFVCHYIPNAICNLQYGAHNEARANSLDLYLPAGGVKPYPLIVWIHGGGWVGGDKQSPPCRLLLQSGFAVASINYRLSSQARFPAPIEDCKSAISWLRANAEKYGIDNRRIGVWGASAGGHLALLVGTTGDAEYPDWGKSKNGISNKVDAVCDWCGPTNLLSFGAQTDGIYSDSNDSAGNPLRKLLGGVAKARENLAKQASPVFFAAKANPPILIMHGDKDDVVPLTQSSEMKAALDRAGARSEFITVPGAGHNFFTEEAENMVLRFFITFLKRPQQSTATAP